MATVGGGLFDNNICSSKSDNGQKIHKNNNNNDNNDNNNCRSLRNSRYNNTWLVASLSIAIWSLLTLTTGTAVVQGAAVYSNLDFLSNPNFEPICSEQQERFIESEGKESSLLLEFNADDSMSSQSKSCKRILSAPSAYGFIVRLILPKIRSSHLLQPLHHGKGKDRGGAEGSEVVGKPFSGKGKSTSSSSSSASTSSAMNEMTSLIEKLNSTALKSALGRTCPLSIFSSLDPHTPQWRVDPCQLEDTAPEMEDPVRLFHGRVRIVWEHGHNSLDSKLMVTVLGKGDQCRSETKHQCLKIGDEPILCISKDLICDGIRHCPYSNEYDSDEDYTMCWKRRRFGEPLPAMESDIFEHFALEVFRNLFAFDVPAMPGAPTTTTASPETSKDSSKSSGDSSSSSSSASLNSTTLRKVDSKKMASAGGDSGEANATTSTTNVTEGAAGSHRRNSTRLGLNSDLSKYGPWGYLMLGMLLCGGALLICGLWASASQHAANNERESSLAHGGVGSGGHNNNSSLDHQSSGAPPNYEELDPPPPYSVLFPNQKAASSTTLSSIGNAAAAAASTTMTTTTTTALPGDNAANRAANSVEGPATTTTTTRVQLEAPASSSSSSSSRGGAGAGGSSSSNSATTTHHVTQ